MNARFLTDYSLDAFLTAPRERTVTVRRDRLNFRPLAESIAWVLAGAIVGCAAVMLGAWGLLQLTDQHSQMPTTTATAYRASLQ
jgi:hypothetical protein